MQPCEVEVPVNVPRTATSLRTHTQASPQAGNQGQGSFVFLEDAMEETSDQLTSGDEEADGTLVAKRKPKRIYYLDWLRIIAIYLVVLFHCVQAMDIVGIFGSPYTMIPYSFMATGYQVGMQLFFHLSGRAQALSPPRGMMITIQRRAVRLLLPFIVAYIILIPPWLCIDDCKEQGNILKFYFWYFTPSNFYFDMAWLWFLPALFVITCVSLPLILFMETKTQLDGIISVFVLLSMPCLKLFGYSWVFSLVVPLPFLSGVWLTMSIPFPTKATKDDEPLVDSAIKAIIHRWLAIRVNTLCFFVASTVLSGNFSYNGDSAPMHTDIFPGMIFFLYFYMTGYMTERWRSGCASFIEDESCSDARLDKMKEKVHTYELVSAFVMLTILFSSSPVNNSAPPGKPNFWEKQTVPIYSASFLDDPTYAVFNMLGSWISIGTAIAVSQAYMNKQINAFIHQHGGASTTIVYIFHWLFIRMFGWWGVKDTLIDGPWRLIDVPLTFAIAVAGSLSVYYLAVRVPAIGFVFGV